MEKSLQTISAKGASVPPGFHAHLGMLYSIVGKSDQMVAQFEDEKNCSRNRPPIWTSCWRK
jgi:hypothetical protein